ncbi:MerR family transcriptional regulator [Saccharopolyspora erythraea]|uniref:MerR family transcriptional regulator n=1 Tax=Saccharopolyspora erythraea TaxID=1836 RepID=UPI00038D42A1|nr:MerR family transcriptional regulator [Saccharopolyspora erythraea]EQD85204.1 MerR family transcriptional regulator [Saccharopolyspora erythraea D]
MLNIGDFAKHGRVSVRMLRHYDAIGLLRPAHVDAASGYRRYEAAQLCRLNRIIALKDLGFTLQQVGDLLDADVSAEQMRGMLRLRLSELEAAVAADTARLRQVEARLRTIESEGRMPTEDVVVKSIPAVRVAELTAIAGSFGPEDIGPVIRPLYGELCRRMAAAGVSGSGPNIAYYEESPEGDDEVVVHAGVTVAVEPHAGRGFDVVDLPAVERAATIVHRGDMDEFMPTVQQLAHWIDANGFRAVGLGREHYLSCEGGPDQWVTEIQQPITKA